MMEQLILSLRNLGFYDVVLPWLLAFSLTYYFSGQIFKDKAKAVPPILGIVVAFYLVIYTPFGTNVESFFTNVFGNYVIISSVVLVILMIVALILGSPGKDETILTKLINSMFPEKFIGIEIRKLVTILVNLFFFGLALYLFAIASGFHFSSGSMSLGPLTWGAILFLAVIGMAVYFVTSKSGSGEEKKQ